MDAEKRWNWQQDDWPQFRFVEKGALIRTGVLKSTRYHLNIETRK